MPRTLEFQDLDIGLLRLFIAVVESGGFTAAQARTNLSLPAITARIAKLEGRLDLVLCRRGRGGFALTPDGERVYLAARRMFAAMGEFNATVCNGAESLVGEVRLGASEGFIVLPNMPLAAAVSVFRRRAGNAALIRVGITSYEQQLQDFQADRIDIGFATFPFEPLGTQVTELGQSLQVLCCGQSHPLYARAEAAGMADVVAYPFVMRGSIRSRAMPAALAGLPAAAESVTAEGRAHLILSGQFLGYLPRAYAQQWLDRGAMREVAPGEASYFAPLHMAVREASRTRPAVAAFIQDLHRVAVWRAPGPRDMASGTLNPA